VVGVEDDGALEIVLEVANVVVAGDWEEGGVRGDCEVEFSEEDAFFDPVEQASSAETKVMRLIAITPILKPVRER
jgi:hypothetical protein